MAFDIQSFINRVATNQPPIQQADLDRALDALRTGNGLANNPELYDRLQIAYMQALRNIQRDQEAAANQQIQNLNNRITVLNRDLQVEQGRVGANARQIENLNATIATLRETITTLQGQVQNQRKEIDDLTNTIAVYSLKEKVRYLEERKNLQLAEKKKEIIGLVALSVASNGTQAFLAAFTFGITIATSFVTQGIILHKAEECSKQYDRIEASWNRSIEWQKKNPLKSVKEAIAQP